MNSSPQKIMTAQEVSKLLKIPLSTIYALSAQGKIRAVKFGRHWRFIEEDIRDRKSTRLNSSH